MLSQSCMMSNLIKSCFMLGNIIQKSQSISPARPVKYFRGVICILFHGARKSLLPLSLLPHGIEEYLESLSIPRGELFMISKGNHKSMPAQVPRGFLNNITSHLFQKLIGKFIKFPNKDKSYNFGTKPKIK